ncbi:MAG: geranylgeranyl reductase family protein [Candidatus Thorarchaeota archaeon]|nr:geranylgeranyl reductase family protein [Candidatus Thorarchaeota archaeon]
MAQDLIVVGGGPAGATCARHAAQLGLEVLLIEKATHPRRKACGGGLTARVKDALDFDFSSAIEHEQCALRLVSPSGLVVEEVRSEPTGYTVRREDFDHLLLKKAEEAGATVIQGSDVIDLVEDSSGVDVFTSEGSHRGGLLVGADGVNSVIARKSGLHPRWKDDEVALCIEASVPMDPSDITRISGNPEWGERVAIEIHLGALVHGYAWAFPKKSEYSLGIGVMVKHLTDLKGSWKKFTEAFEARCGTKLDLADTTSMRIPVGGMIDKTSSRRIMLIGDAAGFVGPATGEGIYYAIESGKSAAEVAQKIASGASNVSTVTYHTQMRDGIGADLKVAKFMEKIMFRSNANMEALCKMASEDPIMKRHTLDFIMGMESYRTMRSRMMKRMLTKHPLKALRMVV